MSCHGFGRRAGFDDSAECAGVLVLALHVLPYNSHRDLGRWRLELIDFRFADLFRNEPDSVLAGYGIVSEASDEDPRFRDLDAPTCVLVDSNGDGVAVPSHNCGYVGGGPSASYSLLTDLGFPPAAAQFVYSYGVLRLDKHSAEPVIARESRFDAEFNGPQYGMRTIDYKPTLLLEHERNDDDVFWTTWTRFATDWTPQPVGLTIFLERDIRTAPDTWPFRQNRANVVVDDASGRQFAALAPAVYRFRDQAPDALTDFISVHGMKESPAASHKRRGAEPKTIVYRKP